MAFSLLIVAKALLLVLLASVQMVESTTNYQVVAFLQNTPPPIEMSAESQLWAMFNSLGQYLLNCEFIKPGTSSKGRERDLGEGDQLLASMLRGSHDHGRDLQATSCPSTCSKSGSTKCKSLGCAFCGKCRRGRELPFSFFSSGSSGTTTNSTTSTSTNTSASASPISAASNFTGTPAQALEVEKIFDKLLQPYCVAYPGCKIWTKVYRLYGNGTAVPITG